MKAILRHKGELMVLNLRELTPPGWFAATVECFVQDEPQVQQMLALPAPAIHGAVTGRFSGTAHISEIPKKTDPSARGALARKQTVMSNLKSGIYRYLPKNPHDMHLNGVLRFREYLRKHPLASSVPLNQLWTKAFPEDADKGSFRLAVAAIGHGRHWTISEGRSSRKNRRIFLIGPK